MITTLAKWSRMPRRRRRELIVQWYKGKRWFDYENFVLAAAESLRKELAAIPAVTNVGISAGEVVHVANRVVHVHELDLLVYTPLPGSARLRGVPTRFAGFKVRLINLGDKREAFLRTWKRLFRELKGWDEASIQQWVEKWNDELSGRQPSVIYHYGPVKIALSSLVDEETKQRVGDNLQRLYGEIIDVVERTENVESRRIEHPDTVDDYDWGYVRRRVAEVIEKYRSSR